MKKIGKLVIFAIVFLMIIVISTKTKAVQTNIQASQDDKGNTIIKITSDELIEKVRIYKLVENRYVLVYKGQPNSKNTNCKISRTELSTTEKTIFKVVVNDDTDEKKVEKDFQVEPVPEQPEPSSTVTPSPSASASPTPSNSSAQSSSPTPKISMTPMLSALPAKISIKKSPTTIRLDKSIISMNVGQTTTLRSTVIPTTARTTLTWSTSNKQVATISAGGTITAVKAGTAVITVKTLNGKTAKCTVKVATVSSSSSTQPKSQKGDGYTQTITLGGKTFKLYKQYAGSYGQKHFNSLTNSSSSGTLAGMGCGPSSIAIVLSGYGFNKNPYDIGKLLMKNSKPSGLPSMQKEVNALGMKTIKHDYSSNYQKTYQEMKQALESGHQIVLYVGKKANQNYWYNFTHSGYHFISILGIDSSNDKVYVGNPGVSGGWFKLSTVVNARGNTNGTMAGWLEIYK